MRSYKYVFQGQGFREDYQRSDQLNALSVGQQHHNWHHPPTQTLAIEKELAT